MAAFRDVASGPVQVEGGGRAHPPSRGRTAFFLLAVILTLPLFPSSVTGTEEYAKETGRACAACHLDPSGGGELTAQGGSFQRGRTASGHPAPGTARWRHTARFVAGFLHLFTAVLWFGTILYVHLLLKPSYAAHGLPRGELIVGWGSIVLIALTGVILTAMRVRSFDALFHTRFGILLTVKIVLYLVMVSTAVIVTFIVGPRLKKRQKAVDRGPKDMTVDELSGYDGEDGRPAYFAYGGRIFDATESKRWKGGNHLGRHQAGFDLSDALKQAPHGEEKIVSLPLVGNLRETGVAPRAPVHLKAFYFMTYFNLVLVLGILLIVSLWRWW
ncbi:MAG: CopD family protein [Candidatus Deferrimicrobiaceae bacterium]